MSATIAFYLKCAVVWGRPIAKFNGADKFFINQADEYVNLLRNQTILASDYYLRLTTVSSLKLPKNLKATDWYVPAMITASYVVFGDFEHRGISANPCKV